MVKYFIAIIRISAVVLALIAIDSCKTIGTKDTVKKYYFNSAFPMVYKTGDIWEAKENMHLYIYKQYKLLQLPIHIDSIVEENFTPYSDTGYLSVKSSSIIHRLFLYDSSSQSGYLSKAYAFHDLGEIIDTLSFRNWQVASVDSILNSQFFKNTAFDKMIEQMALISSKTNGIIKTFTYKLVKPSINDPDTIRLTFNNALKNVPFFISQKLDSLNGMKLVDLSFVFNRKFSEVDKIVLPAREMYVKFGAAQIQNEVGIRSFIERCAKHYQMKNL